MIDWLIEYFLLAYLSLHSNRCTVCWRIIADSMKQGAKAVAEFFDEASVYFSDIVGFTRLAAESQPMEVVRLLNDLYRTLDAVIARHDVYKVY